MLRSARSLLEEEQVAQPTAVIANDNACVLAAVCGPATTGRCSTTFIRGEIPTSRSKESQQRKPQSVFPPKRPSATQRKQSFQTKENPRMKKRNKGETKERVGQQLSRRISKIKKL